MTRFNNYTCMYIGSDSSGNTRASMYHIASQRYRVCTSLPAHFSTLPSAIPEMTVISDIQRKMP